MKARALSQIKLDPLSGHPIARRVSNFQFMPVLPSLHRECSGNLVAEGDLLEVFYYERSYRRCGISKGCVK